MPSTTFSRSPMMMPSLFLSSNSVTLAVPAFLTLNLTGPAGTDTFAGSQPLSVSETATVFVLASDALLPELPPQPVAANAISPATIAAAPVRLHVPDTMSPEVPEARWL